jgi:HK97 family phage prohead protease
VTVQRFGVELRAEVRGRRLTGYASVFNQFADLGNHFEQMAPTAFRSALADPATDVRALFNHDPSLLLGRQASGTLRIGVDSQGLEFEVPDLPNTQAGNDVRELAARGDLSGASFAFVPDEDEWTVRAGSRVRTHTSVGRLVDVSPVTFPAYDGASVALRSVNFADLGRGNRQRSQLVRARARVALGRV